MPDWLAAAGSGIEGKVINMLNYFQILILALIQGACELLPVSSSAHVIAAEKLMGVKDPSSPEMTMLLVMLHTGTMFAVIVYFWKGWKRDYFASSAQSQWFAIQVILGDGLHRRRRLRTESAHRKSFHARPAACGG